MATVEVNGKRVATLTPDAVVVVVPRGQKLPAPMLPLVWSSWVDGTGTTTYTLMHSTAVV